jgi:hypothetical protein
METSSTHLARTIWRALSLPAWVWNTTEYLMKHGTWVAIQDLIYNKSISFWQQVEMTWAHQTHIPLRILSLVKRRKVSSWILVKLHQANKMCLWAIQVLIQKERFRVGFIKFMRWWLHLDHFMMHTRLAPSRYYLTAHQVTILKVIRNVVLNLKIKAKARLKCMMDQCIVMINQWVTISTKMRILQTLYKLRLILEWIRSIASISRVALGATISHSYSIIIIIYRLLMLLVMSLIKIVEFIGSVLRIKKSILITIVTIVIQTR